MPKGINNNMKQHRSFKKDIDLISEMYGQIGGMSIQTTGTAGEAAEHMRDEDGEDKTGHLSDKDLLSKVEGMGTAGDRLIDAAKKRLDDGDSLTAHERDALARDAYGAAEKDIAKEDGEHESYEQKMNQMGAAHGYTGSDKGHPTD